MTGQRGRGYSDSGLGGVAQRLKPRSVKGLYAALKAPLFHGGASCGGPLRAKSRSRSKAADKSVRSTRAGAHSARVKLVPFPVFRNPRIAATRGELPEAAEVRMRMQGSFGAKDAPQDDRAERAWILRFWFGWSGSAAEAAFCEGALRGAESAALPRWRVVRWPAPGKVKIKVKGSGQECPLHTGRGSFGTGETRALSGLPKSSNRGDTGRTP